jgi:MFS transporter, ACS family, glucarate transporter
MESYVNAESQQSSKDNLAFLQCMRCDRGRSLPSGTSIPERTSANRYKEGVPATTPLPSGRLRWLVVAMLFGLSSASYVERVNISVAAELMMSALSLSKSDMALIFNSFLIGYAIFQVPAGWLGDRFGARRVLGFSAFLWGLFTVLSGLLPGAVLRTAFGTVALLTLLRFLLGIAEASTYPVAARAVHRWMTPARRGSGNSVMLMGSSVASALTAPFVSWSMLRYGWRASFYLTSIAAFAISVVWLSFTRKPPPADHEASVSISTGQTKSAWNLNVILLSLSYMSEGYLLFMFVSWLYIYLVEVRGFSLARGGLVASLPWIAAVIATPLGGVLSDRLSARFGRVQSARVLIMTGYMLSGMLLLAAAEARNGLAAVLALCISLGSLYLAESSFWTIATAIAGTNAGVVSGFMNTIGILGGIVSNAAVPVLLKHYGHDGWIMAFGSGTGMGLLCAALWWLLGKRLSCDELQTDIYPLLHR